MFADTDGAPLKPLLAALKPHIVVQSSPEKWHVYWLVDSDFPLDMFGPVQSAIASKFGTDPAVKDLPRLMRLPGFNHCKAEPVPVSLVQFAADLPRYSLDQTIAGLGLQLNAAPSNDAFANMGDDLGGGMNDSYPFTTENAERFLSAAKAAYPNPRGYKEYIAVVSMCAELVAGQSWPEDEVCRICDAVCDQATDADQSNNAALWPVPSHRRTKKLPTASRSLDIEACSGKHAIPDGWIPCPTQRLRRLPVASVTASP